MRWGMYPTTADQQSRSRHLGEAYSAAQIDIYADKANLITVGGGRGRRRRDRDYVAGQQGDAPSCSLPAEIGRTAAAEAHLLVIELPGHSPGNPRQGNLG